MKTLRVAGTALAVACGMAAQASAAPTFTFESVPALDDMTALIQSKFQLGASRADLRRTFVEEGRATLKVRPGDPGIEKYIYDIDLCHYYVWRWNISADYDAGGQLRQAYVNGNIVYPAGTPKKVVSTVAEEGRKAAIYRVQRPRPEAYKGEKSLGFMLLDRDSDLKTIDDQMLIGAGPSRPDPMNMGRMVAYSEVDPWRSIFDLDDADRIAPYPGNCADVDKFMDAQKQALKR
ncbi:hypothetical protein GJ698_08000 [Pseudoduganella sp. FT26W]|uniref:DUF2092 domain-containing protein n=1 Tax=Duganella aquatilis TaxID=2666082 RepID=A0A844D9P7_9BURK|nr:hypothetical protein [Duganella aquatilis]MRW84039.1 hypothetical protein [Duganella aquatilis]